MTGVFAPCCSVTFARREHEGVEVGGRPGEVEVAFIRSGSDQEEDILTALHQLPGFHPEQGGPVHAIVAPPDGEGMEGVNPFIGDRSNGRHFFVAPMLDDGLELHSSSLDQLFERSEKRFVRVCHFLLLVVSTGAGDACRR